MAVKSGPIDNRSRRSRDSEGSMVRQIRFVLVLGGNGLVVVSALLSLLVYFSGEPSGLQYMFLVPAAALAGLAALGGGALGLMTLKRPVAWARISPAGSYARLRLSSGFEAHAVAKESP